MKYNPGKIDPASKQSLMRGKKKMAYNHQKIEKKWQKIWEKIGIFKTLDKSKKPKFYCLDMFPYPSGGGLHVGHPRGYVASDIVSHYWRRRGYNVLHPMGWDAFGLPAENYAIKTGIHPSISTRQNIKKFKQQIQSLGLSYDWSREINTTDPEYYKWTQWIFLQLFKKGLAYEAVLPINFCPSCKTGLANEEVVDGKCERCGAETIRRDLRQWVLKITAYAERLLKDLEELDWPERIKEMQRNWIGKSEGAEITFEIKGSRLKIQAFTTRIDTLFGATYLVLSPEHPLIEGLKDKITNYKYVKEYIEKSRQRSERERISGAKEKTGIEIKGIKAVNPVNNREIPIFVADYVLMHYGTGAIMAVPGHDQRDFDFARKYNLPIIEVIKPLGGKKDLTQQTKLKVSGGSFKKAYEGEGVLINSGRFDGMPSGIARQRIKEWLAKKGLAKKAIHYKLRDWIFSRQRYWGEPIPLVFCQNCKKRGENSKFESDPPGSPLRVQRNSKLKNEFNKGELLNPGWIALLEKDLPLKLPAVKRYQPSGTGESPLANITGWVNVACPECGGAARRETNTMPQWAGSCWYYLAYIMRGNTKFESNPLGSPLRVQRNSKLFKYWLPVDLYVGGAEHAVLHLLYARFWHKFLFDLGLVSTKEPFLRLKNQGLILAPGGQKMSKSRGNAISPDEIVEKYGADTLRLYEMFIGPFSQEVSWSLQGIKGCYRFLQRCWQLRLKMNYPPPPEEGGIPSGKFFSAAKNGNPKSNLLIKKILNQTIKKVTDDIEDFKFNTAISALMILVGEMEAEDQINLQDYKLLLALIAPFAPHLAEELWSSFTKTSADKRFDIKNSIHSQTWPKHNPELVKEETITFLLQVNGKVRDKIETKANIPEDKAREISLAREKVKKWIEGKKIKKIVFVPGKLMNIVV